MADTGRRHPTPAPPPSNAAPIADVTARRRATGTRMPPLARRGLAPQPVRSSGTGRRSPTPTFCTAGNFSELSAFGAARQPERRWLTFSRAACRERSPRPMNSMSHCCRSTTTVRTVVTWRGRRCRVRQQRSSCSLWRCRRRRRCAACRRHSRRLRDWLARPAAPIPEWTDAPIRPRRVRPHPEPTARRLEYACRPVSLGFLTAGEASGDDKAESAAEALPHFLADTGGCNGDCLGATHGLACWHGLARRLAGHPVRSDIVDCIRCRPRSRATWRRRRSACLRQPHGIGIPARCAPSRGSAVVGRGNHPIQRERRRARRHLLA